MRGYLVLLCGLYLMQESTFRVLTNFVMLISLFVHLNPFKHHGKKDIDAKKNPNNRPCFI